MINSTVHCFYNGYVGKYPVQAWKEYCAEYWFNSTTQSRLLTTLRKKAFYNIVGKGGNAGKLCFLPIPAQISNFTHNYLSSANASILDKSKDLPIGKE